MPEFCVTQTRPRYNTKLQMKCQELFSIFLKYFLAPYYYNVMAVIILQNHLYFFKISLDKRFVLYYYNVNEIHILFCGGNTTND